MFHSVNSKFLAVIYLIFTCWRHIVELSLNVSAQTNGRNRALKNKKAQKYIFVLHQQRTRDDVHAQFIKNKELDIKILPWITFHLTASQALLQNKII